MMTVDEFEEVQRLNRNLVRELDVLLNGKQGAAKQPALCDIVAQVRRTGTKIDSRETRRETARHLEIGMAVDRACGHLPEGYELRIELENGCGSASLYDPEGCCHSEFCGDTFGGQIDNAINYAIERTGDAA